MGVPVGPLDTAGGDKATSSSLAYASRAYAVGVVYTVAYFATVASGTPDTPSPSLTNATFTARTTALHPSSSLARLCVWTFTVSAATTAILTVHGSFTQAHKVDSHLSEAQLPYWGDPIVQGRRVDGTGSSISAVFRQAMRARASAQAWFGMDTDGVTGVETGSFGEMADTSLSTGTSMYSMYTTAGGPTTATFTPTGATGGTNWSAYIIEWAWPIEKIADRGSTTTGGSPTAVDMPAAGSIAVGNYLLIRISADNTGASGASPTLTVTDPRSGTITYMPAQVSTALQDPGAADAGQVAWVVLVRANNAYTNGDDMTIATSPAATLKAVQIEEWADIDPTSPLVGSVATGNAASTMAATPISRTPTQAGQMVYGCLGIEGPTADTYTQDSDTTGGQAWTSLTSVGSGATTSASTVRGAYKNNVLDTSAQAWGPTITSRDWAGLVLVFQHAAIVHPIELDLTPVSVPVVPQALGVSAGGISLAASPVTVPVVMQALGITNTIPPISLALSPLAVPVTLLALGVTPGAVSVPLSPVSVPVALQTLVAAPGGVSLAASPVEVPVAVQALTATPGGVSVPLSPIAVPVVPQAMVVSPGGVSLDASPLAVPVTLGTLTMVAAVALGLSPVEVPVVFETLTRRAHVDLTLDPLTVPIVLLALTVAPGAVALALAPAEVAVTLQVLAVAAGGVALTLDPLTVPVVPQAFGISNTGGANATLALLPLEVPVRLQAMTPTAGGVTRDLDPIEVGVELAPMVADAAVALGLSPVVVQTVLQALAVSPGAVALPLSPVAVNVAPQPLTVSPGAVNIALDPLTVNVELLAAALAPINVNLNLDPLVVDVLFQVLSLVASQPGAQGSATVEITHGGVVTVVTREGGASVHVEPGGGVTARIIET